MQTVLGLQTAQNPTVLLWTIVFVLALSHCLIPIKLPVLIDIVSRFSPESRGYNFVLLHFACCDLPNWRWNTTGCSKSCGRQPLKNFKWCLSNQTKLVSTYITEWVKQGTNFNLTFVSIEAILWTLNYKYSGLLLWIVSILVQSLIFTTW